MKSSSLTFIKIIIGALTAFAVVFIIYQLYKYNFVSIKTESAVMGEIEETVDSMGIFFRDEDPLSNNGYKYLDVVRAEGERVPAGGTVARVYADEQSAKVRKEIRDLEEKVATYEEVLANSGSYQSGINAIDQAIYSDLRNIALNAHRGNSPDAFAIGEDLLIEMMKKKIASGDLVSYDATLGELRKELSALKASSGASVNTINTKESGHFSLGTDGLEEQLNGEYLKNLSVENFEEAASLCEKVQDMSNHIGKVVYKNSWSVAMRLPTDKVERLEVNDTVSIRISSFGKDPIRCTVTDIRKSGEECVLILNSSIIDDNILTLRAEEISLILQTHNGIQVRQSALRKVDGKDGVFVKVGLLLRYKEVSILYNNGDYAIVKYEAANNAGLRIYDQVVYKGSNLYDGKAVT